MFVQRPAPKPEGGARAGVPTDFAAELARKLGLPPPASKQSSSSSSTVAEVATQPTPTTTTSTTTTVRQQAPSLTPASGGREQRSKQIGNLFGDEDDSDLDFDAARRGREPEKVERGRVTGAIISATSKQVLPASGGPQKRPEKVDG